MATTGVKFEGVTGTRCQTAAADEDDNEGRRLVSAVVSSVGMATWLSDHMMQESEVWERIRC